MGQPTRTKVISLNQGHHGKHFGGLSVNGAPKKRDAYEPPLRECFQVYRP